MVVLALLMLLLTSFAASQEEEYEEINGTIFCNNEFSFYVNGEFIADDPVKTAPHNAVNVTFKVKKGEDFTLAIDARDLASNTTGLELNDRCLGSGGLRAVFSNGIGTNGSWVCSTYLFGPVNWRECFGAQMVRNQSDQLLLACNFSEPLEGCFARSTDKPLNWAMPDFDDSHWEYATEYLNDSFVGWGLPPEGCNDSNIVNSPELDPNGFNMICPENVDWGDAVFIWRPDIYVDNHLLCRYTFRVTGGSKCLTAATALVFLMAVITMLF